MTTQIPKISTNPPPFRPNRSPVPSPGNPRASTQNLTQTGDRNERVSPLGTKFPNVPADSSTIKRHENDSDKDEGVDDGHKDYDDPRFRPEAGEEPERINRKARFESKHTEEDENEGIENEGDTPRNLMSLSESLKAMKSLRSNFQSFQYEAEAEDYEGKYDNRQEKEFDDEDYVKVESGEEQGQDVSDHEEHYEEEEYYEKERDSRSFSKGLKDNYIEKIHEELNEESHREDDEEVERHQFTEEEEEDLQAQRGNTDVDAAPSDPVQDVEEVKSKQEVEEPPQKHEIKSPVRVRDDEEETGPKQVKEETVKDERDKFFEELEAKTIEPPKVEEKEVKSPQRVEPVKNEETLRKSDNIELPEAPPQRNVPSTETEDVKSPQKEKPVEVVEAPPPKEVLFPPLRNSPFLKTGTPPVKENIHQRRKNVPEPKIAEPERSKSPDEEMKTTTTIPQHSSPKEQEPPQKEELPPTRANISHPFKGTAHPFQRASEVQEVKASNVKEKEKAGGRYPGAQGLGFPFQNTSTAQRTPSEVEYENLIASSAKDVGESALLVRLKAVELELKKEKKKNECLEEEREKLLSESREMKQQLIELKAELENAKKDKGGEVFDSKEQDTLEKLRLELKTTVEGSRLVTEHSNKIIAENEKYKQETEILVNSLEEEKKALQKEAERLRSQIHEEQLKVETQQQKTDFFEKKAREYEESFDLVNRQLTERLETLQKLTHLNQSFESAFQNLPKVESLMSRLQPSSNSVAVQTVSSQFSSSTSFSQLRDSSPSQQPLSTSAQKPSKPKLISPEVSSTTEQPKPKPETVKPVKLAPQTKTVEVSDEWGLSPQFQEQPKAKAPVISTQKKEEKSKEVAESQESATFSQTVVPQVTNKKKEASPVKVETPVLKVEEEKEKSKPAKAPETKTVSDKKASLQADDFFKDIIVPDMPSFEPKKTQVNKPNFAFAKASAKPAPEKAVEKPAPKVSVPEPEPKEEKIEPKKQVQVKEESPKEKVIPKEEKAEPKKQAQFQEESPKEKVIPKESSPKVEKPVLPPPKEETQVKKPVFTLPKKAVVPQFGKTANEEETPKKTGLILPPKTTSTTEAEKPPAALNLSNVQVKGGARYAPKKGIDQNFISVESDSFFGELGLGDSSASKTGGLRESTSSLRTSKQGGDMFGQSLTGGRKKGL